MITDIHTHTYPPPPGSVYSFDAASGPLPPLPDGALYSVGVHPWSTPADAGAMDRVRRLAPAAYAIGETGLDRRRGAPLPEQIALLREHIALSEELGKPLILHIVGCYNEIIAMRKAMRPARPWIIHGFRGKPQLARQLLDAGFYLSFGERYNPESFAVTPPDRRFRETD